jgi:hypothetical protein
MNVIHQEPPKLDQRAEPQASAPSSELTAALRPKRKLLPWLGLALVLGGGAYYYLNHIEKPARGPARRRRLRCPRASSA